jgi:hypothetical protein
MYARAMIHFATAVAIASAAGACSAGRAPTDAGPGPLPVTSTEPDIRAVTGHACAGSASRTERVMLAIQNFGSRGSYRVEFWGPAADTNGPGVLYGRSGEVSVFANYSELVTWTLDVPATRSRDESRFVRWVLVYTRPPGATTWGEPSRLDIPNGPPECHGAG